MSNKVFDIVNDHMTKALKSGTIPWRRPWTAAAGPVNITGYPYNGINFFLLSMLPYGSNVFLTYNNIKKFGGKIKDGEGDKSHPVFFWKFLKATKDRNGNDLDGDGKTIPIFRYTRVWNLEQVEGVKIPKRLLKVREPVEAIAEAEAVVKGYKDAPEIRIRETDRACYYPALDLVNVPKIEQYPKREEYYSTLFHELAHSTGHKKRLARKELMDANYFGSHDYSVEELVAEMGAAYLCAHCGISNETLDNSAAYIASWLDKVKRDPKLFATAAARAQKAFHHIVGKPAYEEAKEDDAE